MGRRRHRAERDATRPQPRLLQIGTRKRRSRRQSATATRLKARLISPPRGYGTTASSRRARRDASSASPSPDRNEEEAFKAPIRARYEAEGSPYFATARLWDDGVIAPSETRRVLSLAFSRSERGRGVQGANPRPLRG